MNHDIDDAIRAGVLREEDIPQSITDVLGSSKTQRITSLIRSVVENSHEGKIAMDEVAYRAYEELSDFMYQAVYLNEYAKREERKVPHIIHSLFNHFRNPDYLPDYMKRIAEEEGVETASCDYVAGMTDHYAVACYQDLFIPRPGTWACKPQKHHCRKGGSQPMPFPPEFLRELNDRNRIEDIAASYVNLRRPGRTWWGCAPSTTRKPPPSVFIQRTTPFSALAATRAGM